MDVEDLPIMSTIVSYPAANLSITYTFENPRTSSAVSFHFIILRIVAILGMLYLTGIQRERGPKKAASILFFLFIPTYPLGSIICRMGHCLHRVCTQSWPNDRHEYMIYLLSATLGLRTWPDASSKVKFLEGGGRFSDSQHDSSDNSNSTSLLSSDAVDFQRAQCSCTTQICKRSNQRSFIHTTTVLSCIVLYCALSLLIYIRRNSHDYVYMVIHLLQGSEKDSHPAHIYDNALSTISSFDQSNAIWAIGGLLAAASALTLQTTQWEFEHKDVEIEKYTSEEPHLLSYTEYVTSLILYTYITRHVWSRVFAGWRTIDIAETIGFLAGLLFLGVFAGSMTYTWVRMDEKMRKEMMLKGLLVLWVSVVCFWPSVHAIKDARGLGTCIKGGECPFPLFLWKDRWSDYIFIY